MDKLDLKSKEIVDNNIEKIGNLFPNTIVESEKGKTIDFDLLRQELSDILVEGNKEKYQLTWPGKKDSILKANTPTNKTLRPCKEESVDFDKTENLYIEGDNLEVLKILQESYLNKIKVIYIDPPYNTGNDFIYKDDFKKTAEEELLESGQTDEEGNRLVSNNQSSGRYHSDWLSMMYSRLKLARNLLTDDGVIFISIDDNEIENLRKQCVEIFGDKNTNVIVWQKTDSQVDKNTNSKIINRFKEIHEFIIICYKDKLSTKFEKVMKKPEWKQKQINPDNDPRGNWQSGIISYEEGHKNEDKTSEYYYSVVTPSGKKITRHWFVCEDEFKRLNQDNRVYYPKDGEGIPRLKTFENEEKEYYMDSILRGFGTSSVAKDEILELFGDREFFSTPKPLKLINEIVRVSSKKTDIILDFFSGSATTAHAAMQLNAEDGGKRKYIMVELSEETDNEAKAYKAGYKNICEIGKERIRRAGKKIKEETDADIDYGFRVYKLDSSNMKDVYYNPNQLGQAQLDLFESNIKEDRTSEDLLTQIILDLGLELSLKIEEKEILGNKVYFVEDNSLVACFDEKIDMKVIDEIAKDNPLILVFKDASFDDNSKINISERMKRLSPETEIKII